MNAEGLRAINRAIRELQRKHDWREKKTTINYYPQVDDYTTPSGYKSGAPISVRRQDASSDKMFVHVNWEDFDLVKGRYTDDSVFA